MEVFLEKIHQLLPVLGVDLLVPSLAPDLGKPDRPLLYCDIKGLRARGYPVPGGFLVLKGSQAVGQARASSEKWPWTRNLRQRLKEEGNLVSQGGQLLFARDTEFSSPSAAAAVIHGGQANGLTAWKTEAGKTLKELESQ
ncbi:MAG TPA: DUF4357 domain-containing protein [Nevskiaceae bacterium]|nr:DUF4357 domain-containing protein [Nevskiaceae bacterium]